MIDSCTEITGNSGLTFGGCNYIDSYIKDDASIQIGVQSVAAVLIQEKRFVQQLETMMYIL
jgi:hypothetical protein